MHISIYQAKLRIQICDRRPEERPAVLASRTHGGVRRRGRRSGGQCTRVGTLQVPSVRESLEGLALHPVCTTACPLKGKHVATSLFRGVRRLRSTKEPQLVVCLPARMRTGLKRGYGLLEDWVIVLGRLEVDDVVVDRMAHTALASVLQAASYTGSRFKQDLYSCIQAVDRRPEERPAVLASRTHGGVRRRGRRARGQSIGTRLSFHTLKHQSMRRKGRLDTPRRSARTPGHCGFCFWLRARYKVHTDTLPS